MNIRVYQNNFLVLGKKAYPCVLGRSGMRLDKQEGDGATPVGTFPFRSVWYRADKIPTLQTGLPVHIIQENMGWCDDPEHPQYNQLIHKPFAASHEDLWREDHLYDIVVVLGHNDAPPIPGRGSCIFMHLKRDNGAGTAGCIALSLEDLLEILTETKLGDTIEILAEDYIPTV